MSSTTNHDLGMSTLRLFAVRSGSENERSLGAGKLTPVPFAIGEEFASKWQFLPFIEKGLTNYSRVDICNVGVRVPAVACG